MKKQFIIFFLLIVLLFPMTLYATSGACSSHNGVDCSKGRQSNGMVYCNDGWTDSMVSYDFMNKCKKYNNLSKINSYIEQNRTVAGMYQDDPLNLSRCMSQGNGVFSMDKLQACTSISQFYATKLSCPTNSIKVTDYDFTEWCICNEGYYGDGDECKKGEKTNSLAEIINALHDTSQIVNDSFDEFEKTRSCQWKFGKFSRWSGKLKDDNTLLCECLEGFKWNFDNSECVMSCKDGYALSLNKQACIKIPQHAHVAQNLTDVWLCDNGYKEI